MDIISQQNKPLKTQNIKIYKLLNGIKKKNNKHITLLY